jgi:hypothetical protein
MDRLADASGACFPTTALVAWTPDAGDVLLIEFTEQTPFRVRIALEPPVLTTMLDVRRDVIAALWDEYRTTSRPHGLAQRQPPYEPRLMATWAARKVLREVHRGGDDDDDDEPPPPPLDFMYVEATVDKAACTLCVRNFHAARWLMDYLDYRLRMKSGLLNTRVADAAGRRITALAGATAAATARWWPLAIDAYLLAQVPAPTWPLAEPPEARVPLPRVLAVPDMSRLLALNDTRATGRLAVPDAKTVGVARDTLRYMHASHEELPPAVTRVARYLRPRRQIEDFLRLPPSSAQPPPAKRARLGL